MVLPRPYDRNDALRKLRRSLLGIVEASRRKDVPHSFDSRELLKFAGRTIRRGVKGRKAARIALLQAAGRAFLLNGEKAKGRRYLDDALELASTDQQRAVAHYLVSLLVYQRVGDYRRAKESFQEAISYIPAASMTRAQATLGLIRACEQLGELEGAEAAYHAALGLGIGEVKPEAQLKYSRALWRVGGEYATAAEENREAHQGFVELRDREGQIAADADLVAAHLTRGDYKKAYTLNARVVEAREAVLDLSRLGSCYANHALALRHLGRLEQAIEASCKSIRYHHEFSQPARKAHSIQSLGTTLIEKGDVDRGMAMLLIAAERASQPETRNLHVGLASTMMILEHMAAKKRHLDTAGTMIARVHESMAAAEKDGFDGFPIERVARFAVVTADLARAGVKMPRRGAATRVSSFPSRAAYFDARRMVREAETHELDSRLDERLTSGPRLHKAPDVPLLKKFLLSFAGTSFQNGNYQEEFGIPQEKAKHHLRELRDAEIIRQEGSKRGSRYLLSFHRT